MTSTVPTFGIPRVLISWALCPQAPTTRPPPLPAGHHGVDSSPQSSPDPTALLSPHLVPVPHSFNSGFQGVLHITASRGFMLQANFNIRTHICSLLFQKLQTKYVISLNFKIIHVLIYIIS